LQVDTTILGLDNERAKELPYIASMGIYVFSKDAMLRLLRENFPSANDFGSEVIPGATEIGMRVSYAREECTSCYPYCLQFTAVTLFYKSKGKCGKFYFVNKGKYL
jgi:ADP-glucose pyrophosphorylase